MKYIVFLIVVCSFLPARGQTIYGRTMAGLPKVEYAPDKKELLFGENWCIMMRKNR